MIKTLKELQVFLKKYLDGNIIVISWDYRKGYRCVIFTVVVDEDGFTEDGDDDVLILHPDLINQLFDLFKEYLHDEREKRNLIHRFLYLSVDDIIDAKG